MIASKLLAIASSALALAFWSTAAAADETAKPAGPASLAAPAARGNVVTTEIVKIKGRRQVPGAAIDVARLVPRAPLPELRQLLVDRIGKAVEKDPF